MRALVVGLEVDIPVASVLGLPGRLVGTVSVEAEMRRTTEGWVPRDLTVDSVDLTDAYLAIDAVEHRLDAPELALLLRQRVACGQVGLEPWPFPASEVSRFDLLRWSVLGSAALEGVEDLLIDAFNQQCRSRRERDETRRMEDRRAESEAQ